MAVGAMAVGAMAVGAIGGGAIGGRLAGRVRPATLRLVVVEVGLVVGIIYLARETRGTAARSGATARGAL